MLILLLLAAGGWYFFRHYDVQELGFQESGFQGLGVQGLGSLAAGSPPEEAPRDSSLVAYRSGRAASPLDQRPAAGELRSPGGFRLGSASAADVAASWANGVRPAAGRHVPPLRIASWALDGFGPSKLADEETRQHLVDVMRQFDVIALQQIATVERDLLPRLADAINAGQVRYDYVLGAPSGPEARPEQLAFVFDTTRVRVDRSQTYTLADPDNQITFDPLVAWFQAAQLPDSQAWTFSLVNLRVDLARAPSEVALLDEMLRSVRHDGRGEDDVVLLGLFQADDRYLIPVLGAGAMRAAVRRTRTDIFGRHQTANVLVDVEATREFLGRGNALDFLRIYNLSVSQAEAVSSYLPVYGEFTAHEGGEL